MKRQTYVDLAKIAASIKLENSELRAFLIKLRARLYPSILEDNDLIEELETLFKNETSESNDSPHS